MRNDDFTSGPGPPASGGLADQRANIKRLQSQGLPLLATPAELKAAFDALPR